MRARPEDGWKRATRSIANRPLEICRIVRRGVMEATYRVLAREGQPRRAFKTHTSDVGRRIVAVRRGAAVRSSGPRQDAALRRRGSDQQSGGQDAADRHEDHMNRSLFETAFTSQPQRHHSRPPTPLDAGRGSPGRDWIRSCAASVGSDVLEADRSRELGSHKDEVSPLTKWRQPISQVRSDPYRGAPK